MVRRAGKGGEPPVGFDDEDEGEVDAGAVEGLEGVEVVTAEEAGYAAMGAGAGAGAPGGEGDDLLQGLDLEMPLRDLLTALGGAGVPSLAASVGDEVDEEAQAQALRRSLEAEGLSEALVELRRVTKVTKGGNILAFRAVVVIGDRKGKVGMGVGKGKEVVVATAKAVQDAKGNMIQIPVTKSKSIPHKIVGKSTASRVVLRPAAEGTGVLAGGATRTVLELAGVQNILTKQLGSNSLLNNARAVLDGLGRLKSAADVAEERGVKVRQLYGIGGDITANVHSIESSSLGEAEFESELAKLDSKCRDKILADVAWLQKNGKPIQPTMSRRVKTAA